MESPYAAISLPDVARNGAQSSIGVSPVSVSGVRRRTANRLLSKTKCRFLQSWVRGVELLPGQSPGRFSNSCLVGRDALWLPPPLSLLQYPYRCKGFLVAPA